MGGMKHKEVHTVTNNDGDVRLRIYDGHIPPDAYWQEMYNLERAANEAMRREYSRLANRLRPPVSERLRKRLEGET